MFCSNYVYYSRLTAESSPYYELLKKKNIEVLYLYQSYDEQILINLDKFNDNRLVSAEKYVRDAKSDSTETLDLGNEFRRIHFYQELYN